MRTEQERVRQLLTEAVGLLCRNSLQFDKEVQVEGLIGITLDKRDILLISIHETFESATAQLAQEARESCAKAERVGESSHKASESSPTNAGRKRQSSSKDGDVESCGSVRRKSAKQHGNSPPAVVKIEQPTETEFSHSNLGDNCPNIGDTTHNLGDNSHLRLPCKVIDYSPVKSECLPHLTSSEVLPSTSQPYQAETYVQPVYVKEEQEEEGEECHMISDSEEDVMTHSQRLEQLESQLQVTSRSWAEGDSYSGEGGSGQPAAMPQNWTMASLPGGEIFPNPDGSELQPPFPIVGQSGSGDTDSQKEVCPICSCSIAKYTLKRHIRTVHMHIKPYQCPQCERAFAQNANLKRHCIRQHGFLAVNC